MTSQSPQHVTVMPCGPLRGNLQVPGDKSISHRIAMLGSLADGVSEVQGFLKSEDCCTILAALAQLGAAHEFSGDHLRISGTGGRFRPPRGGLDLGNSGTGIRLLAGLLAGQPFTTEMTGDASLRSRPMRRIAEPLVKMGATVELTGPKGCAPVRVTGGALTAITYAPPVASAQVKSCVLFAGLYATGTTVVEEVSPTRDHSEQLLRAMGVPVVVEGLKVRVPGFGPAGPRLRARSWKVPGDLSSAAFWITAAAGREGSLLALPNVGWNPRRNALVEVLRRMGAEITFEDSADQTACERMGTLRIAGRCLKGTEVGGSEIPDLIDELPLVAVAGALAEGRTVIRDAAELRVKESDRIRSVVDNLKRLGVRVEEREDGMVIEGPATIKAGQALDSYGDHRLPMALAILAMQAAEPVRIEDTACVNKSYPGFWADLGKVGGYAE